MLLDPSPRRLLSLGLLLLATWWAVPCVKPQAAAATWDFALIGDLPYTPEAETNDFPHLIEDLNRARLEFVVHDGDIKSGSSPCTDAVFRNRFEQFQTIQHPLFYVFGDNEWCDCKREGAGSMDPLERLTQLRSVFCLGSSSLGARTLPVVRQSHSGNHRFREFSENIRWTHKRVLFAGFNLPGGGNNFGEPDYPLRNAANLAWLTDTFAGATANTNLGVVLVIQANPQFEVARTNAIRRGFNAFLDELQLETAAFAGPVLLVHGDSHYFRIDKPLLHPQKRRRMEHFTRVETFGHPDAHWVRVTVDPVDPQLFQFRPQIVEKNREGR
ncbi:MAG: hypothetical protein JNN07_27435 [Verrucomicrobiales bacterium]|nr:hypothetical protein [Verrucomicrobiales bacterium]